MFTFACHDYAGKLASIQRKREEPMNASRFAACAAALAVMISGSTGVCAQATKDQALAVVKKAVAAIQQEGAEPVYNEITGKTGKYNEQDLYVVVYGLDGTVRAHGANKKLVGQNMLDIQDVDGKYFVKERVTLANEKGTFWQEYKFVNPATKKIENKDMYCEKLADTAVCAGVYK
jgi:cytochrome c